MPRGGPRPNSGGARPGAGRKPKVDIEYQETMRGLVRKVVTLDDWEKVLGVRLSYALAGNADAFRDLEKWVMGTVPKEIELGGKDGDAITIRVEYADADPAEAP